MAKNMTQRLNGSIPTYPVETLATAVIIATKEIILFIKKTPFWRNLLTPHSGSSSVKNIDSDSKLRKSSSKTRFHLFFVTM